MIEILIMKDYQVKEIISERLNGNLFSAGPIRDEINRRMDWLAKNNIPYKVTARSFNDPIAITLSEKDALEFQLRFY